jgi:hypothetical protein
MEVRLRGAADLAAQLEAQRIAPIHAHDTLASAPVDIVHRSINYNTQCVLNRVSMSLHVQIPGVLGNK